MKHERTSFAWKLFIKFGICRLIPDHPLHCNRLTHPGLKALSRSTDKHCVAGSARHNQRQHILSARREVEDLACSDLRALSRVGGGKGGRGPFMELKSPGKVGVHDRKLSGRCRMRWRQPAQHKAQIVSCGSLVNSPWGHNAAFPMLAEAPPFV